MTYKKGAVKEGSYHYINKDSIKAIPQFLKFGAPSAVMLWLEVCSFQMLMVFSGYISTTAESACVMLINIVSVFYMIAMGTTYAATNLVGNELGANKPQNAKVYTHSALMVVIFFGLI